MIKKYLLPGLIAVTLMMCYQFFLSPVVKDLMDDWSFLHQVRINTILQQQKQNNQK